MANQDRSAMLQQLRERLLKKKGGFRKDPAEWKAPQVGPDEEFKAKAYILPPVGKGDVTSTGVAETSMEGLFFVQVGDHWINKKKYPCPRVYDNDDCSYCQLGFDLLNETDQKAARSEVARAYLPRTQFVVNLYFPDVQVNPENLRDKVFYYAMPKTIFDKLEECIQMDNAGDDPDDPKAWGIFYDAQDAYPLSIVVNKKGDYNSYVDSKLLANGRGKIAPAAKKIDEILSQRHDIPSKYPERSVENRRTLQGFVNDLMNSPSDGNSDDGFDADETADSSTKESKKDTSPKTTTTESATKATTESTAKPTVEPNDGIAATSSSADAVKDEAEDDELQALLRSIKKDD